MGGDEFIIVFVNVTIDEAEIAWKRITSSLDKINQVENRSYIVSASHGIIEYDTIIEGDIDELIKRADDKMYVEKRNMKKKINIIREEKLK